MILRKTQRFYVYLALGIGILIIGFSAIFVRLAGAPGTVASFYRMGIAAAVMALPFFQRNRKFQKWPTRRSLFVATLGGIFFAMDLSLWASGIMISGATTPTLMANTAPLWVGLGSFLIFRERQNSLFWFGLILAMVGALLVMGQDLSLSFEFGVGTFMGLLAALFYGAYYLVTQRGRASLDTISYFWLTALSSSLVLLFLNVITGQPLLGYSAITYLYLLALGIIVQVLGWQAINFSQGHLPASVVAPTLLGQPIVTAFFASLLLGERFTIWHILGGAAVLAGVYLVHRSRMNSTTESQS